MYDIKEVLKNRYTVKSFDPKKKLTDEQERAVEDLLQLCPSSINSQPWEYIIATTEEGKKRVATSTDGNYAFNTPKILDASTVIVMCSRLKFDDRYLKSLLDKQDKDGRFINEDVKNSTKAGSAFFVDFHNKTLGDTDSWLSSQVYLAMGNLLLGAAVLEIDACPMEGFDAEKLDIEFNLSDRGMAARGIISLGFRAEDDFNASLPKSRWDKEQIIKRI
ncbi:MAG: oxygen-insensitive NAD(P)H nitroreductase [Desulfotalea sp.]